MEYGRILAAARHYDARRIRLETKETELLRHGTEASRKANDNAIESNWKEFTSKVDRSLGVVGDALLGIRDELELAEGYADDHPIALDSCYQALRFLGRDA